MKNYLIYAIAILLFMALLLLTMPIAMVKCIWTFEIKHMTETTDLCGMVVGRITGADKI